MVDLMHVCREDEDSFSLCYRRARMLSHMYVDEQAISCSLSGAALFCAVPAVALCCFRVAIISPGPFAKMNENSTCEPVRANEPTRTHPTCKHERSPKARYEERE